MMLLCIFSVTAEYMEFSESNSNISKNTLIDYSLEEGRSDDKNYVCTLR
jgi:hypothetical protein